MTRLRVLTLTHSHPDLYPSGTALAAHELHRAFRERDDVHSLLVAGVTRLHRPDSFGPALEAARGKRDELLLRVDGFDRLMLAPQGARGWLEAVEQLLDGFRPHIVHMHHAVPIGLDLAAVVARLRPSARQVMSLHDFHLLCVRDGLLLDGNRRLCAGPSVEKCAGCVGSVTASQMAVRERYIRGMLGHFAGFVAPSRFVAERHVAAGVDVERISIIANGAAAPTTCIPIGHATDFGFFGNLVEHKGVLTLLRAWPEVVKAVPAARLRLNGDLVHAQEPFRQAFVAALAAAGETVVHAGAYERHEVGRRMSEAGWVVTPSIWYENQPLVVGEAFAHHRPVICSDTPPLAELVPDDGAGLRFALGDPHALARCLIRCATEPGLLQRCVSRIPAVPTWPDSAAMHFDLYNRIAAGGSRMLRRAA